MSLLLKSLLSTFHKNAKSKSPSPAPKVVPPKPPKPSSTLATEAQSTAKEIIAFAREEADKIRTTAQNEMRELQNALRAQEEKLRRAEDNLVARSSELDNKNHQISDRLAAIEATKNEITELRIKQVEKLEKISSLSKEKAKEILLAAVDKKMAKEVADRIREAESEIKDTVEDKARDMLVDAMYHGATEYVAEFTISTVKIPDDDVKGRIIGKDGRNIRTFEKVTGVDIDMDETPGEVRLSCYDGVRREVARVALERLIKDGRIQPTRIEEYVAKAKRDIEKIMYEEGKK
ncbi:MAG: DUF3552 domain-containing protein, partial [Leptonema sp. (in: Bacteria)]|nr:DUF3552 domain-containing protein [Leptonema sp. (in: bacteria)]